MSDFEFVLGVDESGTGAYAGPFTVCAFLAPAADSDLIKQLGARDSKSCSRFRREQLVDKLAGTALIADVEVVPHTYTDQREAWREAVMASIRHCMGFFGQEPPRGKVLVQIDGSYDMPLIRWLKRCWYLDHQFLPKGDQLIPQISAASIYAKTERSRLMTEAHERFPVYGWNKNDGYGTADHRAAIELHGVCELHRRIRPLIPYFER